MKRMNGLRNHYTPEYKANIVKEILREEKSIAQIVAEHGNSDSQAIVRP
jgi:transposase-like protein